ncbi:hypothetical protein SULAZ_0852 [Sulfurihydrogenibium azorense Az-Fu1]|uniref:Uncharacterized protein n=1 Tax=Sulfurihydrogenibium azorense (strain DSM 15241 / OCM 825 / Az-Fu1) TaxID=204536 RepID=C1DUP4_SULAA|nr:hypothetical protein [Sulfurihydrogenibium azorense]ACN98702.1 hypothetical protein SULAZ_0852 [Sulfurihydrogenibium azorense Az-Fu1]
MEKEKELELKKLEIEKAKVYEGILRTLVFTILTLGAGIGTVLYRLYSSKELDSLIISILSTFVIVFSITALWIYLRIHKILKEV